jgi:hypothetical protein
MTDINTDTNQGDEDEGYVEPAKTMEEHLKRLEAARSRQKSHPPKDVRDPAEIVREAEEKERKRWEAGRRDELIKEASLNAWEKERLADAEGREARLAPFDNRDPYEYRVDQRVPRVAPPKEKTARRYGPHTDALDDAETELTAVIAECRYLMREMAFESARTTPIASDRLRFIESARTLAETSAAVGKSIAPLRNPALIEPEEKKKRARR